MLDSKPLIGITLGDPNGVGPEVTLKALADNKVLRSATPVVYGSVAALHHYRKLLKLDDWQLFPIKDATEAQPRRTNVVNCWPDNLEIKPGEPTPAAGLAAWQSLKAATADLKAGKLQALVTGPINKNTIQNDEFRYPGHTEYFAEQFEAKSHLMLLVGDDGLRVGVVTGHLPLAAVPAALTIEGITSKIKLLAAALQQDFGILRPRLAVLALYPHAGEGGLLGDEEAKIITPALESLKNEGYLAFGPFPADGFFGSVQYRQFDAVLGMYHDQGLVPFKTLAFHNGVNYTAGLSVVRTSPDHGTAYSLAGKGTADESSLRAAFFLATDIVRQRLEASAKR